MFSKISNKIHHHTSGSISYLKRCFTAGQNITFPRKGLDSSLPNASTKTLCDVGPDRKVLILGYGSIGEGVLPLVLRHFNMPYENITVITMNDRGKEAMAAKERFGVNAEILNLLPNTVESILAQRSKKHDIIINATTDVSSIDIMKFCAKNDVLYVDTVIEPWQGEYFSDALPASERSNYCFRESLLKLRNELKNDTTKNPNNTTMVSCHGANPGMVSHFVKQALVNIGNDTNYFSKNNVSIPDPVNDQKNWAKLAKELGIKVIHIAEYDTQVSNMYKKKDEFVNTWSIDGFISEGYGQPAELGWGTHEKLLPFDGHEHDYGSKCAIYLDQCGMETKVRTWTPQRGPFHGYLVTHNESITISDYFTYKNENDNNNNNNNNEVIYRPTVHYAYRPCNDAVISVEEFLGTSYVEQKEKRLMLDDIVSGMDELGVLLCGHEKNAYWYGSQLDVNYARSIVENNQATSLQVTATALAGIAYAIKNPNLGILECEEIDYKFVLDIIEPYVAPLYGEYTDWTPLQANRNSLWKEDDIIDKTDPWQFQNIRCMERNIVPVQQKMAKPN